MKREMRHGRRAFRVLAIAMVCAIFLTGPAFAVHPLLVRGGIWLGKELVSYGFGKLIDKVVGSMFESELDALRRNLEAQLASSAGAERVRVEKELALTPDLLT
ncbi:MAG: hypothetical protein ACREXM_20385 [Gammaproteobacteria bacterium]